jgi:hypothetical protein
MFQLLPFLNLFFQEQDETIGIIGGIIGGLVGFVVGIIVLVAMWKIYTKAGKPGWAVIIPIYNIYIMLEIVGRPWWWLLLMLIPGVNAIIGIILVFDLAKSFGKGAGFALGLLFLNLIFMLILAFGDARYVGPVAAS